MSTLDRIVPEIFVHDGVGALEFYKRAFGAVETGRTMAPNGTKRLNGQLEILGHRLFVCDEFTASEGGTCRCPRTLGGTGVRIVLEVDDADGTVAEAGDVIGAIERGDQHANASGKLSGNSGVGRWIGKSSSTACSGRWEALRES